MYISEWLSIFQGDKANFGVAKNISEWQIIFRSSNAGPSAYFGVAMHISEWHCIFQSGIAYFSC